MDETQALSIVAALADGVNPVTGEIFGPDSPYQSVQVVRALYCVMNAVQGSRSAQRRRESLPRNAGKRWTPEEDKVLLTGFDGGKSIADLAQQHERTAAGIAARLEKHGRVDSQSDLLRSRYVQPPSNLRGARELRQNVRPANESR
jgi:hypothetical protein